MGVIAAYARISDGTEGEETSTEIQLEDIRKYVELHKLKGTVREYVDVGISGFKDVVRPQYDRLIDDVRAGQVDTLVIYKIDRLTRSLREVPTIVELIEDHGLSFHSVSDHIDTTNPMGVWMLQLMISLAELESRTISFRVKRGHAAAAKKGRLPGGPRAFGWNRDGSLRKAEAKRYQDVARRFIAGEALKDVLDDTDTSTWVNRLKNPRALGYRRHGDELHRSPHIEPMLTVEEWEAVQRRLGDDLKWVHDSDGTPVLVRENFNRTSHGTRAIDPVRPLLRCSVCGKGLRRAGKTYSCRQSHGYIPQEILREYVITQAVEIIGNRQLWGSTSSIDRGALEAERAALTADLQEVSRARFMDKTIGEIEWRAVRDPLAERIEEIDDTLKSARPDDFTARDGVRLTLDDWWDDANPETKRAALASVIDHVTVMPERQAIAELREEAGGPKKWKARPGKAELTLQRRVRIRWKQFYEGEGDAPNEEEQALLDAVRQRREEEAAAAAELAKRYGTDTDEYREEMAKLDQEMLDRYGPTPRIDGPTPSPRKKRS